MSGENTPNKTNPLHVSMREPYVKIEKIKFQKGKFVDKRVCGLTINEVRKMKLIDIELNKENKKAYVDLITGSLYEARTGRCLSSA